MFLSARPHVYKDVSENVTYEKFRWLQETRGLHTSPTLLAGSLDTGKYKQQTFSTTFHIFSIRV